MKLKNKNPKKILIIGDSQSAIQNAEGKKITYTWPNLLREKLKGVTIDVLAIGGKVTKWMLENLPNQLLGNKYDRVIIYGGGNDTSNASISLETTLKNFQKMVDLSTENGADVFINLGYKVQGSFGDINILPVGKPGNLLTTKEQWIPYVEKRKELQRLLPQKITGVNFIPLYDLESKTSDGIHPTAAGHKIVAEKIYDSILLDPETQTKIPPADEVVTPVESTPNPVQPIVPPVPKGPDFAPDKIFTFNVEKSQKNSPLSGFWFSPEAGTFSIVPFEPEFQFTGDEDEQILDDEYIEVDTFAEEEEAIILNNTKNAAEKAAEAAAAAALAGNTVEEVVEEGGDLENKFASGSGMQTLKDLIFSGESSNYDAIYPSTTYAKWFSGPTCMTQTISTVVAKASTGKNGKDTAIGRYQNLAQYVLARAKKAGLNPATALYNEKNQELMGDTLIQDTAGAYLSKKTTGTQAELEKAVQKLGNMWASLPSIHDAYNSSDIRGSVVTGKSVPSGKGKFKGSYVGQGGRHQVADVVQVLIQLRIALGLPKPVYIPSYYKSA